MGRKIAIAVAVLGGMLVSYAAMYFVVYVILSVTLDQQIRGAESALAAATDASEMTVDELVVVNVLDDPMQQQPLPTQTPYPTLTPLPTYTPQPTYTSQPTYTREPTHTLTPITTPEPTNTNVPITPFSPPTSTQAPPTVTPTSTHTVVPTVGPTVTPLITIFVPTSTSEPTATAVVTGLRIEITESRVNLRSGPGTSYSVSDVVTLGAVLQLIGRTSDGYWYQIRTSDGRTAWVGSTVAEVADGATASSVPIVATAAAPAPANRAPTSIDPNPAPSAPTGGCCKICRRGKACGNSCINRNYTCHKPPGCACNAGLTPPTVAFGYPHRVTAALLGLDPVSFLCLLQSQAEDV